LGTNVGGIIMKKISTLLLLIVGFLFIGMFMPRTHAAPTGDFSAKVSLLTTESVEWTESLTYSSGPLNYGHEFSIDANTIMIPDMEFAFWLVNGNIVNKAASTSFFVTTDLEVIAVFKPIYEFVVLYIDSNNQLVDIDFVIENDATSTLLDGSSLTKPGLVFAGWDKNPTNIVEDTVIKALYDLDPLTEQVTIDILDNSGTGAGTFNYNDLVTLTASIVGFTHWTENGEVVSYDPTYTFSAIKNRTLKAESGGTDSPVIFLQDVSGIRAEYESYLGQVYLPDGYTLLEAGLLVSNSVAVPTYGIEGVEIIVSSSINTFTNEFLRSIPNTSEFRFIRGYALVNNGDEIELIYSMNAKHSVDVTFQLWVNTGWNPRPSVSVVGDFTNWAVNHVPMILQVDPNNNFLATIRINWFSSYIATYAAEYKYLYYPGTEAEFYKPDGPNLVLSIDTGVTELVLPFTGGH